ncbi:MAG: hypothetical protein JWL74_200 [Alphaproteobacteria bacterium]|nr:hypothetical protein [Alphaproteobacteria bacterium]
MASFREELATQRWDDHRFYHHSLVNQSLHFLSACTFLLCYVLLFVDAAVASLIAWTVAMWSRQSGHFFFEPKSYDTVNGVTHEYKEAVKVGYNLFRKWVLMGIWAGLPLALAIDPTFLGMFAPAESWWQIARQVGWLWLGLGLGGLVFRVVQLCFTRGVQTGLVWGTKIVTDPINDFKLYRRAPLRLLQGERYDHGLVAAE